MKIDWLTLRALPAAVVLQALGTTPHDPRCPSCDSRLEVYDDPHYGTSVRCCRPRCRIGRLGWCWPEFIVAEAFGLTRAEAAARLMSEAASVRPRRAPRTTPILKRSRSVVAAFLAS